MPNFFNSSAPNLRGNSLLSRGSSASNLTRRAGELSAQKTAQLQDSLRSSQQGFADMFDSLAGQGFQPYGFEEQNLNTAPGTEEENMIKNALKRAGAGGGGSSRGLLDSVFTPLGDTPPGLTHSSGPNGRFRRIFSPRNNTSANFNV